MGPGQQSTGVTIGVDLASQAAKSAVATVEWSGSGATLTALELSCSDVRLRELLVSDVDAVAIDCPLGWPKSFTDLIVMHRSGDSGELDDDTFIDMHTLRETDRYARALTRITPLRVAADRIAFPALRLARVMMGVDRHLARDGSGRLVEAYPAAALKSWGLPSQQYKRSDGRAIRSRIVDEVVRLAPWLDVGPHAVAMADSDDALDAVVCALVGRATRLGLTHPPQNRELALEEGWIHIPTTTLAALDPRT